VYISRYCSVPFVGLRVGLKLAGLSPRKCTAKSPAKTSLPHKLEKFGSPGLDSVLSLITSEQDLSIVIWPGKNRRSEQGEIWESKFGLLRGNLFCRALRGAEPRKLYPRKMPRKRSRAAQYQITWQKIQVTWQNQVTYRRISKYFDRNNIKSPGSAEVRHYLAFWVSFLQYQNSIDYLVHQVFFATSRWKDTH